MEAFTLEEPVAWGTMSLHVHSECSWKISNYKHTGRTLEPEDTKTVSFSYIVPMFPGDPVRKPFYSKESPFTKVVSRQSKALRSRK